MLSRTSKNLQTSGITVTHGDYTSLQFEAALLNYRSPLGTDRGSLNLGKDLLFVLVQNR